MTQAHRARPEFPDVAALLRTAAELAVATVVAVAVSAGLYLVLNRAVVPRPSFAPDALVSLSATVLAAGLLVLVVRRGWSRWRTGLVWCALAALPTATLTVTLSGSRFYLNGLFGDQSFRTAYLARLSTSPVLADMTYADLPPYYPAGWFWVAGRITDLLGLQAWAAYKPLAIATMAVAGALSYSAWSAIVGRRPAIPAAVATGLIGLQDAAYEPYAWLVTVLMPPLAVFGWRVLRAAAAGRSGLTPSAVVLGGSVGTTAAVYTLLAAASGLLGGVLGAVALATHGPGRSWRRVAGVGAVAVAAAVPVAALVWAPYVVAALRGGAATSAAQQYLPEVGARFPLPFLEPSTSGVLSAVGLVWIVLHASRRPVATGLALLVGTCYLWYALSFASLLVGTTLLPFRLEPLLLLGLWIGAAFAAVDGWHRIHANVSDVRPVRAAAAVLALLVIAGTTTSAGDENRGLVDIAFADYTPEGLRASGPADPADAGAWNGELHAAVREMTGRESQDLVVLTTYHPMLSHHPYRGFQAAAEQYANPLARFDDRRQMIRDWAGATDPADLVRRLDSSPYRPPTVFVLRRVGDGLRLDVNANDFPRGTLDDEVVFDRVAFDGSSFVRREVGPFTVVVRR